MEVKFVDFTFRFFTEPYLSSYDISIDLLNEFSAVFGELTLISQQVGFVFDLFTPLSLGHSDLTNDFILAVIVQEVCVI